MRTQNNNLPRKITKHFEFSYRMLSSSDRPGSKPYPLGDLTICGVGEFFPNEDPEDQIVYDIDQIFFEGKDIKPVLDWMEGSVKEIDEIHDATISHLQGLFRADDVIEMPKDNYQPFPDMEQLAGAILHNNVKSLLHR